MGKVKKRKNKPKPKKSPKIEYPPVPTKKWIPPDERKKKPLPPGYQKPEGITQKLKISSLKKIWHQFVFVGNSAILLGNYSQSHKKYNFKTNGYQGACNCAVACVFASSYQMAQWDRFYLDRILDLGDDLYVKSITRSGTTECDPSVPPQKVHNSIYLGRRKVSIAIDDNLKVTAKIVIVAEQKVKEAFQDALTKFFQMSPTGIFTILGKSFAFWIQDNAYYLFDPTDHNELGELWKGLPPGCGYSSLCRSKTLADLIEHLYNNVPAINMNTKFEIISCTVQRVIQINTWPPERLEDVVQPIEAQEATPVAVRKEAPEKSVEIAVEKRVMSCLEDYHEDSQKLRFQEISPEGETVPEDKRPDWIRGSFRKRDSCNLEIPGKAYPELVTYYIELEPAMIGILRGATCQTDVTFSKYQGRQSMGNALSALTMLRLNKSKTWIPMIVNTILKYGDLLYRDAMLTIPRTQSLKLSNFQKKTEYEGKNFLPVIEDFVVIGRLQSTDFDVLDLHPALESFLADNECCVIIGPLILAVWVEDGRYYMYDPNERDIRGKAIVKQTYFGDNMVPLNYTPGVACVMWFADLKDLVQLYMDNVEKPKRRDPFYLSKVQITDYVEIPEAWYNFSGILPGKWLLRGSRSQSDRKYSPKSRNCQGPANCLVALALQGIKPMKDWAEETVDQVLDVGDGVYCESVDALNEKNIFVSNMLTLSELNKKFKILDKEASCDVQECVINGLINPSDSDLSDLEKGIEEFFNDNERGIVTSRNMSTAIWKKDEVYYYFDSYDRDEKGLKTGFGTACTVRTLALEDLVASLEANLDSAAEDWFNISRVDVVYYEIGTDNSVVLPHLNNYTKVSNNSAILRSSYSEKSTIFGLNCDKQTIPMCLAALAFNRLKPSVEWTRYDMDDILRKGNALYVDTMNEINSKEKDLARPKETADPEETPPAEPANASKTEVKKDIPDEVPVSDIQEANTPDDETAPIEVKSMNVKKEFFIGLNQFTFEFDDKSRGTISENLKEQLQELLSGNSEDENERQEVLLESKPLSVTIWKDENVYYVFDSKPRDKQGYVIGMEDWSEPEDATVEDILGDVEDYGEEDEYGEEEEEEGAEEDIHDMMEDEMEEGESDHFGGAGDAGWGEMKEGESFIEGEAGQPGATEQEDEWEGEYVRYFKPVHKSSSFWGEQEKNGRACVRWFARLEDLIDYICGNIPPKLAKDEEFSLKLIKIANRVQLKDKWREDDQLLDAYGGDWYYFLEIEHGFWILRGTKTIYDELFPEKNRGRQLVPSCCIALVIVHIFGMMSFNEFTVDSILTYGDRLYTFVKRSRKKNIQMNADKKLNEDEINWLLEHEDFEIGDVPKKICLSKFLTDVTIMPQFFVGDINSNSFDLKAGLSQFFEKCNFGLLECKGLTVGIWRGKDTFYMFDGLSRGPSGLETPVGTACVTRYLSLDKMASVFKSNVPKLGRNTFYLHNVEMVKSLCPRARDPKPPTEPTPNTAPGGFRTVIPGKTIVRGNITQEDPKFGKGPNVFGSTIAVIALTMSLVHKASTWSRPILDDIIELGAQLYEESVETLGYDFDPWQDKMTIDKVQSDFEIGVLRASCEFRNTDQRGIIDAKSEDIINLRQGIERFFEENTHGIVVTVPLTLAIWEEEQDGGGEPLIYMFDPNPRGPLGMPVFTGVACVVTFVNAKMAAEHIIGCILEPGQRDGEFTIVPVEIIVGNAKTRRKPKKTPTKSSIVVLPRCSKLIAAEEKRLLRGIAENARRKSDAKRRDLIGRKGYYTLRGGEAILRGYRSQNSDNYSEESRNNQDITNCIVAIVMHHLFSVENWNSKHIDLTLDTGDQLYIDSYIAYGPPDKKLGLENVMRKFLMRNLEIHVTVYKPIISDLFNVAVLSRTLNVFFQQEQFCMLSYDYQWVTIIFKSGLFYLFDPHERNLEGRPLKKDEKNGYAIVLRFDDLNSLALRLADNLSSDENQEVGDFTIWLINVDIKA